MQCDQANQMMSPILVFDKSPAERKNKNELLKISEEREEVDVNIENSQVIRNVEVYKFDEKDDDEDDSDDQ